MKTNLDIELLRTLIAFADTGSFKHAAQIVFRSQPAVSMQMKRLEAVTGQELFMRHGRELALTEQGLQLVLKSRQLLVAHDRIVDDLRRGEIHGEVRIGMPDDYASLVIPTLLPQFAEQYPSVLLNIVSNTTPVLEDRLRNGELDIAVLATTAPEDTDFVLTRERIVWVASNNHDVHLMRPLVLALFSDESPIYRRTIDSLPEFLQSSGDALEFRIGVVSKNSAMLLHVVAAGFAVATMAECVVPTGYRVLGVDDGFPDLGYVNVVIRRSLDSQSEAASHIAERIMLGSPDYNEPFD